MPTTTQSRLGPRELATIRYLARGLSTADIARNLGVRPTTVRSYIRNIGRQWGTRDRAHIVTTAYRRGILTHTTEPTP